MVNVNLLKSEIVKNGYNQETFCQKIGMAHSTFVRKMKKAVVTTDEAKDMCNVLNITEDSKKVEIFLQQN